MTKTLNRTRFAGIALAALFACGLYMPAHAQVVQPCTNANCWLNWDEANDPGYQSAFHSGYYTGSAGYPYGYSDSYNYNAPYTSYAAPVYSQYPYNPSMTGTLPPPPQPAYAAPSYSYNYQYQYAYQYQQYPNQTYATPQPAYPAYPQPAYASRAPLGYSTISQPAYPQYAPQYSRILKTYWKNGCYYTVRLINGVKRTTHICS